MAESAPRASNHRGWATRAVKDESGSATRHATRHGLHCATQLVLRDTACTARHGLRLSQTVRTDRSRHSFGRRRAKVARCRPKLPHRGRSRRKFRPKFGRSGPSLVEVGQRWSTLADPGPKLAEVGPSSVEIGTNASRCRANLGRFRLSRCESLDGARGGVLQSSPTCSSNGCGLGRARICGSRQRGEQENRQAGGERGSLIPGRRKHSILPANPVEKQSERNVAMPILGRIPPCGPGDAHPRGLPQRSRPPLASATPTSDLDHPEVSFALSLHRAGGATARCGRPTSKRAGRKRACSAETACSATIAAGVRLG